MKKIVGIDFGTTNVRICEWDIDSKRTASSSLVGRGNSPVMPAVIAFSRLPGGEVNIEIGEDADERDDDLNDTRVVIRNIKRWAVGSDEYVSQHLEWNLQQRGESWPTWWDPDSRAVRLWNKTVPVEEVIRLVLKEAISRAGLEGAAAEWRAGCPVDSDMTYRKALISALADLGCTGKIQWITEEPLLLLSLGMERGSLQDGSYLVYDLGGGSFDCAIAEVSDGSMTILSEEGIPTLGGMNIDNELMKKSKGLNYDGRLHQLRGAKEQLSSSPEVRVGNITLTQEDIRKILRTEQFVEKTLAAVLAAYKKAKLLWKRDYFPEEGNVSESHNSLRSLNSEDMVRDIDRVILVGGPTQFPYFRDQLAEIFGNEKIITSEDLVLTAGRADILDPALTAISHGACYTYHQQYVPVTLDRVPASVTLTVTDENSTLEDRYEAFHKLPYVKPMADHIGRWVSLNSEMDKTYSVLIETADSDYVDCLGPYKMRVPREGYYGPSSRRIRLIIDRLGIVWVELDSISERIDIQSIVDRHDARTPFRPTPNVRVPMLIDPFWKTEIQNDLEKRLYEKRRQYAEKKAAILRHNITHNPFGHHERPG